MSNDKIANQVEADQSPKEPSPPPMKTLANWNGTEMPLDEVMVPAMDRAFLFGDAVYEVIRIYGGRLWRLADHLDRLNTGLADLKIPYSIDNVEKTLKQTLTNSGEQEATAYIQITRGAAPARRHYFPDPAVVKPNCLIYIEHFAGPNEQHQEQGTRALLVDDIRWQRNDLKVTSLLANCMASQQAHAQGCTTAIMVDKKGFLTEASHSSVFAVRNSNLIVSPQSSTVLPGITKRQVIELCTSAGITMQEGRLSQSDIASIDELIVTDTVAEIVPIVQLGDSLIGNGKPGPIVKQLQAAFRQSIDNWLAAQPA